MRARGHGSRPGGKLRQRSSGRRLFVAERQAQAAERFERGRDTTLASDTIANVERGLRTARAIRPMRPALRRLGRAWRGRTRRLLRTRHGGSGRGCRSRGGSLRRVHRASSRGTRGSRARARWSSARRWRAPTSSASASVRSAASRSFWSIRTRPSCANAAAACQRSPALLGPIDASSNVTEPRRTYLLPTRCSRATRRPSRRGRRRRRRLPTASNCSASTAASSKSADGLGEARGGE